MDTPLKSGSVALHLTSALNTVTFTSWICACCRAEVGLLSHNVVVEGALQPDPDSTLGPGADQYGAQIFIHRMGPLTTPVR